MGNGCNCNGACHLTIFFAKTIASSSIFLPLNILAISFIRSDLDKLSIDILVLPLRFLFEIRRWVSANDATWGR